MKNQKKFILGFILLILMVLTGFISTFLIHSELSQKKVDFILINKDAANLPVDLPQYLFNQLNTITLTYPHWIWLQDAQSIQMKIEPLEVEDVESGNGSNSYSFYYEVRLDLNSIQPLTVDTIIEPISEFQKAFFNWMIVAPRSGKIDGIIWVYIHITDRATGVQWENTRLALPVHIQVVDFLGLTLANIRVLLLISLSLVIVFGIAILFLSTNQKKSR